MATLKSIKYLDGEEVKSKSAGPRVSAICKSNKVDRQVGLEMWKVICAGKADEVEDGIDSSDDSPETKSRLMSVLADLGSMYDSHVEACDKEQELDRQYEEAKKAEAEAAKQAEEDQKALEVEVLDTVKESEGYGNLVETTGNALSGILPEGFAYDIDSGETIIPEGASAADVASAMAGALEASAAAERASGSIQFMFADLVIHLDIEYGIDGISSLREQGRFAQLEVDEQAVKQWIRTRAYFPAKEAAKYPNLSYGALNEVALKKRHPEIPEPDWNAEMKRILRDANKGGKDGRPHGRPWIRSKIEKFKERKLKDYKEPPKHVCTVISPDGVVMKASSIPSPENMVELIGDGFIVIKGGKVYRRGDADQGIEIAAIDLWAENEVKGWSSR